MIISSTSNEACTVPKKMYAPFRGGTNPLELFTTKEPYGVTTKVIHFLELTCLQAGLSPPGYQYSESAAKIMQVSL